MFLCLDKHADCCEKFDELFVCTHTYYLYTMVSFIENIRLSIDVNNCENLGNRGRNWRLPSIKVPYFLKQKSVRDLSVLTLTICMDTWFLV